MNSPLFVNAKPLPTETELDAALDDLVRNQPVWAAATVAERIELLTRIKDCLLPVADAWAQTAAERKGIVSGSSLAGEEWLSGPYAVMSYCNLMIQTLSGVARKSHLSSVPLRELPNGQLAARVLPATVWDRLLLSGISAEVWMQPGVTRANLVEHTASIYAGGSATAPVKLALVLGAGNIASIAPLDCFHKLFAENQVVLLKMNPVNDYLIEFLTPALKPLIDLGVLRIVRGDAQVGQYMCQHPQVDEIHITGSGASHDAIVWGSGDEAARNKAAGTPKNPRRITSELGAVCPTIVVPGPWSAADLAFQAEHVATQKLHNSGFNCIACQVLIVASNWAQKSEFVERVSRVIKNSQPRALYYPGAGQRLADFKAHSPQTTPVPRRGAEPCLIAPLAAEHNDFAENTEVFGPALSVTDLPGDTPEAFLIRAIAYANEHLHGTLGANILIHPATMRAIGRRRFETLITDLRYGCIAINAWTGVGFLAAQTTWGAFPGHTLADVQSGIGVVHNTLLFDRPERSVIEAPFRPFPRNLFSGSFAMLPKPPWFITHRRAHVVGRLLTAFQHQPAWSRLPAIFLNALRG